MTNVFNVLDTLKAEAEALEFINTVTIGDASQVDLDRDTTFPLCHIQLENSTIDTNSVEFTIKIACIDVVDHTKEDNSDSNYQNKHIDYILNTQHNSIGTLITQFMRGSLRDQQLQVDEAFSCTPIYEEYENILVGWEGDLVIKTQNKFSIC